MTIPEESAVEVLGENGAYYKVILIEARFVPIFAKQYSSSHAQAYLLDVMEDKVLVRFENE
jgi:hypothetical protein